MIHGGAPLAGSVRVNGAKNAALPMMAAALLTDEPVVLRNVPRLRDIETMSSILEALGVSVKRRGRTVVLRTVDRKACTAPYELVRRMRASFCVLGPLLGRRRKARVSLPGGCVIGVRPVDLHLKALRRLGARIRVEGGYVLADGRHLRGRSLYLGGPFGPTVTGTANLLMAAVLARGTTVIDFAACEPEVQDLARLLVRMGARIEGIGSPRLVVHGVAELGGAETEVVPDRIEAGTFLVAAAATRGDVRVEGCRSEHLTALIETLREIGVKLEVGRSFIAVRGGRRLRATDVTTLPYPGFPTDLQAQLMALLTRADGISIVREKIYPDRFMHVAELARLGADIRKEGDAAVIRGVRRLHGAQVMASDLRASAALVIAGLAAEGITEVRRIYHIDRGYEQIERRLNALGGRIERVPEPEPRSMDRAA